MKKKSSRLLLICCCMQFATYSSLYAAPKPVVKSTPSKSIEHAVKSVIEPFGNVKWEDNVYEVLSKICEMDSVKEIGFARSSDEKHEFFNKEEVCNDKNLNIIETAYSIKEITTPKSGVFAESSRRTKYSDFTREHLIKKYLITVDNKKYDMSTFTISIAANPIIINDIYYVLTYYFSSWQNINAAMLLNNIPPLSFKFEEETYYTYHQLSDVKLKAYSGQKNIIRFNAPEILNSLLKKYEKNNPSQGYNGISFDGANDSRLIFNYDVYNDNKTFIKYSHEHLHELYSGKYDELIKKITKKSEFDMSDKI